MEFKHMCVGKDFFGDTDDFSKLRNTIAEPEMVKFIRFSHYHKNH